MILAAATVDKPINVDVNVIIHLVDFGNYGNFATSSSISHLVFNRGETQDDWLLLLVGYNMGAVAVGAGIAPNLFLFLLLLSFLSQV